MFKKIFVSFCLFIGIIAFGQDATSSPYSFYGIGELKFKGSVEQRAMGGLSIFRDSLHINLQNPAGVSRLTFTTFTVGANTNSSVLATAAADNVAKRTSIDYLAVGLPLGKLGVSFGLLPFSAVGYQIAVNNPSPDILFKSYDGSGSINKVFLSAAYNINKNLSAGINVESNFGKITTNSVQYPNDIEFGTREFNTSNASGINTSLGLMYNSTLKSKIQYSAGLTFVPASNLTFANQRFVSIEQFSPAGLQLTVDAAEVSVPENKIKIPSKLSFGVGVGENRKWQIGTEIVYQSASNFGERFNNISNVSFETSTLLKLGGYYTPKYNSFTSYFQRVTYRGGFNYQNSGLVINNKSINEQNISIGLGLPLGGTFSNMNISFEKGRRGTKLAGLVIEDYTNLSISLSLNDKWFVKRRFE